MNYNYLELLPNRSLIWSSDVYFTETAQSDLTSVEKERMKDVDVLDIQDSEMDKSNIGTHAVVRTSLATCASMLLQCS